MRKIFFTITVMSLALVFTACSEVDFTSHEYTPDGSNDNSWTIKPESIDEYGIFPSDFTLACKPVAILADQYDGALTLKTEGDDADPVEQYMKVRATSLEGNAINIVFDNFSFTKDDVPTSLGTIQLSNIALAPFGTGRVKFETEQVVDTPSGPIAFNVKATGNKDDMKMDIVLTESSGNTIAFTYSYPSYFEKNPKDPRFNGTPVSNFDMDNTGTVSVEIDGVQLPPSTEQVTIMATDGTHFNFSLKNFILKDEESPIPVGTVKLKDVELKELPDGSIEITYEDESQILAGDDGVLIDGEPVEFWLGPMLPPIPIKLTGTLKDGVMNVDIDIDMQESIGQTIIVNFNTKQENK